MPATSVRLALIVAAANLAVCALVGTVLLVTPGKQVEPGTAAPLPVTTPPAPATLPAPSSESTLPPSSSAPPGDTQPVSGAAGFQTLIPLGWTTAPVPRQQGATQATDPADPKRFVRFGGSPATGEILQSHQDYEKETSKRLAGFTGSKLTASTLRGFEAVAWVFEWTAPEGLRHVQSVYWRKDGVEYFTYASSLAAEWGPMGRILTTMTDNAKP